MLYIMELAHKSLLSSSIQQDGQIQHLSGRDSISSQGCFSRASQNQLSPRRVMSSPKGHQSFGYFYMSFPAPGTSASSLDQHQEMPKAAEINMDRDINHQKVLSHQATDLFWSAVQDGSYFIKADSPSPICSVLSHHAGVFLSLSVIPSQPAEKCVK